MKPYTERVVSFEYTLLSIIILFLSMFAARFPLGEEYAYTTFGVFVFAWFYHRYMKPLGAWLPLIGYITLPFVFMWWLNDRYTEDVSYVFLAFVSAVYLLFQTVAHNGLLATFTRRLHGYKYFKNGLLYLSLLVLLVKEILSLFLTDIPLAWLSISATGALFVYFTTYKREVSGGVKNLDTRPYKGNKPYYYLFPLMSLISLTYLLFVLYYR